MICHDYQKVKPPCYKCENRAVGCHSSCSKYSEWKEDTTNKHHLYLESKKDSSDARRSAFESRGRLVRARDLDYNHRRKVKEIKDYGVR